MFSGYCQRPTRAVRHKLSLRPAGSTSGNSWSATHSCPRASVSALRSLTHSPCSNRRPAEHKAASRALCGPQRRKRRRSFTRPHSCTAANGQKAVFTPQPASEASLWYTTSFQGTVQSARAKGSRAAAAVSSARHSGHKAAGSK